jgi:peptide deformylase
MKTKYRVCYPEGYTEFLDQKEAIAFSKTLEKCLSIDKIEFEVPRPKEDNSLGNDVNQNI